MVSGTMTFGEVQAFVHYSRHFTMPIKQIATKFNLLQSGLASAERISPSWTCPIRARR